MNFRYPIFLDITGKRCIVIGEGYEIPGKVRTLVERGANVSYINPTAEQSIAEFAAAGRLRWEKRTFLESDLSGCFLVITDQADNSEVFRLAEQSNVLCNASDDPDFCRFSFGSTVSRDHLTIAISTNGVAPALAVRLRQRLEKEIGQEYSVFTSMLSEFRPEIAGTVADFETRRDLWYKLVDSAALELIRQDKPDEARRLLRALIDEAKNKAAEDVH
jgi:precorrin-2 dehydrogenase / sirohydrochlorin ferrochelatase